MESQMKGAEAPEVYGEWLWWPHPWKETKNTPLLMRQLRLQVKRLRQKFAGLDNIRWSKQPDGFGEPFYKVGKGKRMGLLPTVGFGVGITGEKRKPL